jgi:hypothetical protein
MSAQGWIVLGVASLAVLFFTRKFFANLGKQGANAGCGCSDGGGCCGKGKRKA